jgi:sec-independent protein translocase protein TatC
MTFGEHLEELRRALIRSLAGVAVGCVLGFGLANTIVNYLKQPLDNAIERFTIQRASRELEDRLGFVPPEAVDAMKQQGLAPRTVMFDPGQLVETLRAVSPDALEGIRVEPYHFAAADIVADGVQAICRRLRPSRSAADNDHARLAALWKSLSPEQQDQVSALAGIREPLAHGSGQDTDAAAVLAEILNSVIRNESLYDWPEFAEWVAPRRSSFLGLFPATTPTPTSALAEYARTHRNPDQARRLNRLLLWRLFQDQLVPAHLGLRPVEIWEPVRVHLQSLQPHEPFMIWLKAAMISGFVIASPWVFYQIWVFVAAGLYPHEKRYVHVYLPVSIGLFLGGVALAFFFAMEPVLNFLFEFNASMGINPQPRLGDWLSFVMILPLGFGIAFQLPIVMLFLNRIGLISVRAYLDKWRLAVVIIAFISMVFTPADPISMLLMLIPLVLLYFGGIAMCQWMPGARRMYLRAPRVAES